MHKINTFKDLIVWQKSHILVLGIYEITKAFPNNEKFGLISQMRRAAVSVSANIAEGFKRRGIKDKINFYNTSQSSLTELQNYLILVQDLKYLSPGEAKKIDGQTEEVGKMLNGLISSIKD